MTKISKHNRIISMLMAMLLVLSLCACASVDVTETQPVTTTPPAKYSIGVIQSYDDVNSEHTYQGFSAAFRDKGYHQTEFHTMSVVNCKGDKAKCKEAAERYVSEGVNLIFAIGEPAAVAAVKATKTIPVVFTGVTDPIEAGLLKSCEKPDKNATGVSDLTPVYEQFAFIKELFPEAKSVSSVYKATDVNSILISTLAQSAADSFELEYSPFTAGSKEQLDSCIENALEDTDVLFLIDDKLTRDNVGKIIKAANKKKIPVISSSESLLSSGCLATSVPDYTDMGYNAGELALILIKDLRSVSELSVEYPKVCVNKINPKVAEAYGIDIETLENVVAIKN